MHTACVDAGPQPVGSPASAATSGGHQESPSTVALPGTAACTLAGQPTQPLRPAGGGPLRRVVHRPAPPSTRAARRRREAAPRITPRSTDDELRDELRLLTDQLTAEVGRHGARRM